MSRRIRHIFFASCLLLSAGFAGPEQIYKSTMPDGKVIYGPEPAPGAKKVEKITPRTENTGVQISTPEQKREVQQRQSQQAGQAGERKAELERLQRELQDAEAAREAGREPQEGETIGKAGGGTRLTDAYFERQKALEAAVQDARKRFQEAQGR